MIVKTDSENVARDIVEISRHLSEAKARCAHGEWLPWLETEFGWSDQQARRFMHVHEAFGKSNNMLNLPDLPMTSLYALAAPSTPEPARAEQVTEYAELVIKKHERKAAKTATGDGGVSAQLGQKHAGGRPSGGDSLAARQLGLSRQEVQRSSAIAAIVPEAKAAARDAGVSG